MKFKPKYNTGCLEVLFYAFLILLLIPLIMFLAATISGCLIWLVWNLALVPIFSIAPITLFWQGWGLGLLMTILVSTIKSIFGKKDA